MREPAAQTGHDCDKGIVAEKSIIREPHERMRILGRIASELRPSLLHQKPADRGMMRDVVVAKGQNQRVAMKEKRHQQNLGCDQPYSAKTEPAAGQPSAGFGSPLGKKNPGAKKNGGQYDC